MRSYLIPTGVLAVLLVSSTTLPAAIVSSNYSGIITSVYDPSGALDGSVIAGGTFSGSYSYDTGAANLSSPPLGYYAYFPGLPEEMSMSVNFGNYSFAVHSNNPSYLTPPHILVYDDVINVPMPILEDVFHVNSGIFPSHSSYQTAGPTVPGELYSEFSIELGTPSFLSPSPLNGVSLPTSTLNLVDFPLQNSFVWTYGVPNLFPTGEIVISGILMQLEAQVAAVPEPTSLSLLGCGALFGLAGFARRRRS